MCNLASYKHISTKCLEPRNTAWDKFLSHWALPLTALSLPSFLSHPQLYDMFHSVMKYLPGPQQRIIKNTQELEDFMIRKVKQNQSTLDLNSPRNFIDSFLIRIQEVIPASVG